MPRRETSLQAVLEAYAAARRKGHSGQTVAAGEAVENARQAVKSAETNELKAISRAYDRTCLDSYRDFERDMRTAGNNHGRAMTAAVEALDERRKQAEEKRNRTVAPFEQRLREALNDASLINTGAVAAEQELPLSAQPLLDQLEEAQDEAARLANEEKEAAYQIYLVEKQAQDLLLAETTESLLNRRQEASSQALEVFQQAKTALLKPLLDTLAEAEQLAREAECKHNTAERLGRQARMEILQAFQENRLTGGEAVARLRQLAVD